MFQQVKQRSKLSSAFSMSAGIYHATVRCVRSSHSNAIVALAMTILQACMLVAAFYAMFSLLGLKGAKLRGDFILYIMSGIFMYMTHVQILFSYHTIVEPVKMENPVTAMGLFILSWATGCAVGLVLFSIKPWFPTFAQLFSTFYRRVNMFASGKMFVANTLPPAMIMMFDWNPLFHIIDQVRGVVFNNYFPRNSDFFYPMFVGAALLMIGLIGEFYTLLQASSSWATKR